MVHFINMEITNQVEQEERRILMALSQAYLEWEKQTKRLGLEQGREQGMQQGREQGREQGLEEERRATIENLLRLRFGSGEGKMIDQDLQAIIPNLMSLPNAEYTSLLLQQSKEELIQHFRS
jgi:flagellar biosynthesis/type III secretory pathway protein FliH